MVSVVERCNDDEPLTCRYVGSEGAVFIRTNVEPLVLGFVVQKEIVGNTVAGGVHQCSVHQVGVLERNLERFINGIQSDTESVKELLADKVVIRGIFVVCRGSVKHDIIAAWGEVDGDDSRFTVVVCREVQALSVLIDWLQGEFRRRHRSVLKRAILGRIQVHVHRHRNRFGIGHELHRRDEGGRRVVDDDVLCTADVQALIADGKVPRTVGQVEDEFTHFSGGGSPHQTVFVGGHNLRSHPVWKGRIPPSIVFVQVDDAVDGRGWLEVKGAEVQVLAGLNRHQLTKATVDDDTLGGHVVGEA